MEGSGPDGLPADAQCVGLSHQGDGANGSGAAAQPAGDGDAGRKRRARWGPPPAEAVAAPVAVPSPAGIDVDENGQPRKKRRSRWDPDETVPKSTIALPAADGSMSLALHVPQEVRCVVWAVGRRCIKRLATLAAAAPPLHPSASAAVWCTWRCCRVGAGGFFQSVLS